MIFLKKNKMIMVFISIINIFQDNNIKDVKQKMEILSNQVVKLLNPQPSKTNLKTTNNYFDKIKNHLFYHTYTYDKINVKISKIDYQINILENKHKTFREQLKKIKRNKNKVGNNAINDDNQNKKKPLSYAQSIYEITSDEG